MTVAQHKINLAQKILQTSDKEILKAIDLIQEDEPVVISQEQKRELDARLADIESGNAKFYTWTEAKKMIRNGVKKRVK